MAAIIQGVLENAATAAGRDVVRPAPAAPFGETDEDELLYALGWPHMVWLVAGDAKPADLDASRFSKTHPFETGPWPATAVVRRLRSLVAYRNQTDEQTAIHDASPIGDDEREQLFDFVMTEQFSVVLTYLLEALLGARIVLDALVERLERQAADAWGGEGMFEAFGSGSIRALHFVLLRADRHHAATSRARLEAIWDRVRGPNGYRPTRALDLTLHGRAGVERFGWKQDGRVLMNDVAHATDDLAWARERALEFVPQLKSRDRGYFDARVAYLAGDDSVLTALAANPKGIYTSGKEAVAIGLSRARPSKPLREAMTALGTKTAKRWLKAHPG